VVSLKKRQWAYPDGRVDNRMERLKSGMERIMREIQRREEEEEMDVEAQEERARAFDATAEGMRQNMQTLSRACVMTRVLVRAAAANKTVGPALHSLAANLTNYRKHLLGRTWRSAVGTEVDSDALVVALERLLVESSVLSVTERDLREAGQLGRALKAISKDTYTPPAVQDAAIDCIQRWRESMAAH